MTVADRAEIFETIIMPETPVRAIGLSDAQTWGQRIGLHKFRVAIPLILLGTVLAQLVFEVFAFGSLVPSPPTINSITACVFANLTSLIAYRQMRLYPGARRLNFLSSSFVVAYATIATVLLVMRVPISVWQLVVGCIVGAGLSWAFAIYSNRQKISMLIVPSRRTIDFIEQLPDLPHRLCASPADILGSGDPIIVDLHRDIEPEWEKAIAVATLSGARVYHVRPVFESLTGKVKINHLSENTFGSLVPNSIYLIFKQFLDRVVAALALVFTTPIILLAALAIRLETRGSPFFRQERVGHRGQTFTIIKLRTMVADTGATTREKSITTADDPRITRVGHFLRGTRIDELPQLINVLRGEMSIIGPRPEARPLCEWYESTIEFYPYRHIVRPGITGWAQVNQGHVASTEDVYHKLQYDFYYIKHFSIWLDLLIAIRTVGVMLTKFGSR